MCRSSLVYSRPVRELRDLTRYRRSLIRERSAGKSKSSSTGKGNPWLAATPGEVIAAAARTDTFLGERCHPLARRRGKSRAIVAVGNSILTIIWNLLSDPDASYHDLGHGYYQARSDNRHRERDLIRRLERLTGQTVSPAIRHSPFPFGTV